ncbi:MAG: acyl-CoA dehydrogenase [Deltaproteobacteria bacterium]|nr:acyl-CoA dehydrogenase [Deltaproteobacteria bacterium]
MTGAKTDIRNSAAAFAARHIALRPDLGAAAEFPADIWKEMARAGLFKIGIAEAFGGAGGGYADLLTAGEAFVESGRNLGLAVSWLYQQMLARFVVGGFGTPPQQRQYLTAAAAGECTLSFAVSEPGLGARPKLLATEARRKDGGYLLSGEKTYLTNGPIADLFIVVAVTGNDGSRRRFTAFMVPRGAAGVTVGPPLEVNFLKPSPHGGIRLDACPVLPQAVLGREGAAWTDLVVPLGEIEDIVMMGPTLGGMAAELAALAKTIANRPSATDAQEEALGALGSLLAALRAVAREAADCLDRGEPTPVALTVAFARMAADFHTAAARLRDVLAAAWPDANVYLQRDMEAMGALKKRVAQIRQKKIGLALLK